MEWNGIRKFFFGKLILERNVGIFPPRVGKWLSGRWVGAERRASGPYACNLCRLCPVS
ncbi:hypothetical protein HanPSC8_Chr04g0183851 [Helianthus annuus]|nr:hypothetical protein HanIR_Chr04g0205251 [Helianthus annuus]KAJ0933356.1 hypothetical protein HanPSC8_Chr04g0183851 [Helianthus annuus]